jgi:chemosensory pili system protein ChpB (putative protein-glutamate methylesterase)
VKPIRVGVLGANAQEHAEFFCRWASQGLQVVLSLGLEALSNRVELPVRRVDTWLVLLNSNQEQYRERLLKQALVPLVFAEPDVLDQPSAARYWSEQLLYSLAHAQDALDVLPEPELPATSAHRVWVLAASLGGLDAWMAFLAALPADIPAAFLVAQHIEAYSLESIQRRIQRETRLQVVSLREQEHQLVHGQVLIVPPDRRLMLASGSRCRVSEERWLAPYTPNISQVMLDVAQHFGAHAGAIIFTGTCNDGASACERMRELDGQVWTQSAESCVHSSMPDAARATGVTGRMGTPSQLAQDFIRIYHRRRTSA